MKVICDGPPIPETADDTASAQQSRGVMQDVDVREATPSSDIDVKRFFYLKNSGTRNLVLDVEGMNGNPGTPVILGDQKYGTNHHPDMLLNQLWYEDADTSTIRTAMNDFCLDVFGQ